MKKLTKSLLALLLCLCLPAGGMCALAGSYDEVVYCAACKTQLSRTPRTVEKLAHTPAAAVQENVVAAKPGVAGSYDEVVYCAVCKAQLSRTAQTIPALPREETKKTASTTSETAEDVRTELVYEPVSESNGVDASDDLPVQKALETVGDTLDADDGVTVDIPGVDQILDADEMKRFDTLPVKDRLLVTLSALGFADAMDDSAAMSGDAKALADDIAARKDKLSDSEKQALLDTMAREFAKQEITVDGKSYESFAIDVVTDRNGQKSYDRYTFYNVDGAWKLYSVEKGEYREVKA